MLSNLILGCGGGWRAAVASVHSRCMYEARTKFGIPVGLFIRVTKWAAEPTPQGVTGADSSRLSIRSSNPSTALWFVNENPKRRMLILHKCQIAGPNLDPEAELTGRFSRCVVVTVNCRGRALAATAH